MPDEMKSRLVGILEKWNLTGCAHWSLNIIAMFSFKFYIIGKNIL